MLSSQFLKVAFLYSAYASTLEEMLNNVNRTTNDDQVDTNGEKTNN